MSVSLSFDGFNPGFRLVRARRLRRMIYCLARSESCASVRSLGILGFSGCVGGLFLPKIGYLILVHPSYALRARSAGAPRLRIRIPPLELGGFDAGFITSRARNPAPQFASSESGSSAVA